MKKTDVLRVAQERGLRGVTSDDDGLYTCNECGSQWHRRDRYVWWPIRLGWHSRRSMPRHFFMWHGWQVGWDGIEQRVFGQTFHVGRLFIAFGRDRSVETIFPPASPLPPAVPKAVR